MDALTTHAPSLRATARRHSLCRDDADDAYQRAVEILLRRAGSLDPARAHNWMHTVVKHEAMAVRRARQQLAVGSDELLESLPGPADSLPEEQALSTEETSRAVEALRRLKPQEVKALWLKASGLSYAEIAEQEGWTYTKVNRCLTEGRKSFLSRYAGIESGAECDAWRPVLSALVDGEATATQMAELRPHLRNCQHCKATVRHLHSTTRAIAAAFPVLAVSSAAEEQIGIVERAWSGLVAHLTDKAATLTLKAQAAGDAFGSAKIATVAATAVAATGGGAVVVHHGDRGTAGAGSQTSTIGSLSPERLTASAARRLQVLSRAQRAAADREKKSRSAEFESVAPAASRAEVSDEFGPETTPSQKPAAADSSASTNGTEFGP